MKNLRIIKKKKKKKKKKKTNEFLSNFLNFSNLGHESVKFDNLLYRY